MGLCPHLIAMDSTSMNKIVYYDESKWAAVPANNGGNGPTWQWGDEIVVGFTVGTLDPTGSFHQCAYDSSFDSWLARSTDAGESWDAWRPARYAGYADKTPTLQPCPSGIDFTEPGFMMRVEGHGYHGNAGAYWFYSRDKGITWTGPHGFGNLMSHPELEDREFTGRTAYIVNGPDDLYLFLSARDKVNPSSPGDQGAATNVKFTEKCFLARMTDGGKICTFISWMVPWSDRYRAAMPAPVRFSATEIVAAIRRKSTSRNWIDCFGSADDGNTWSFLSEVTKTEDENNFNGNPPSLVKMSDGRLCCVFGNRSTEQIIAKDSDDGGRTWSDGQVLRDDFKSANGSPDLGYPRLFPRSDGKVVTAYFWCTADRPQTHIEATIF